MIIWRFMLKSCATLRPCVADVKEWVHDVLICDPWAIVETVLQFIVGFVVFLGFFESGSVNTTGLEELSEALKGSLTVIVNDLKNT